MWWTASRAGPTAATLTLARGERSRLADFASEVCKWPAGSRRSSSCPGARSSRPRPGGEGRPGHAQEERRPRPRRASRTPSAQSAAQRISPPASASEQALLLIQQQEERIAQLEQSQRQSLEIIEETGPAKCPDRRDRGRAARRCAAPGLGLRRAGTVRDRSWRLPAQPLALPSLKNKARKVCALRAFSYLHIQFDSCQRPVFIEFRFIEFWKSIRHRR